MSVDSVFMILIRLIVCAALWQRLLCILFLALVTKKMLNGSGIKAGKGKDFLSSYVEHSWNVVEPCHWR